MEHVRYSDWPALDAGAQNLSLVRRLVCASRGENGDIAVSVQTGRSGSQSDSRDLSGRPVLSCFAVPAPLCAFPFVIEKVCRTLLSSRRTLIVRESFTILPLDRSIFGGDNFPYPSGQIFNDVPPSSFGYQWIQELSALGITSGCGGGSYRPDDPITREQMAVFIIKARYGAATNFPYSPTPYFTDVPVGAFAFAYIQRMDQDGITSGCTATTYCPDADVTRAEMAVFIMRGMFNELLPSGIPYLTAQPLGCPMGSGSTVSCGLTVTNANFDGTTQVSVPEC